MNSLHRCFLTTLICFTTTFSQAEPLRLVTHHFPPYQIVGEGGNLSGRLVELAQCTLTEMGQAYQVDNRPLARAKKEFLEGQFDGVFVLDLVNQSDSFGAASEPLMVTQRSLFSITSLTMPLNSPEMKALKMGVLHGSTLQKWLMSNDYTNVLSRYEYPVLFELLQLGRLDAVFAPYEAYLNERDYGHIGRELKVKHISEVSMVSFFSFSWLKKHPQFLPKFNAALARCK